MATKYRGESQLLTILINIDLPENLLPEGVSKEKTLTVKIGAYPAVWRILQKERSEGTPQRIHQLIEDAIQDGFNKLPKKPLPKRKLNQVSFEDAFNSTSDREFNIREGKHYRGKHKKMSDLEDQLKVDARWLYMFFKYWQERRSDRPPKIKSIYDARTKPTKDPVKMTIFCCQILHEEAFLEFGEKFPNENFRTTYLRDRKSKMLEKRTAKEVMQLADNQEHPLYVATKVCIKLQE